MLPREIDWRLFFRRAGKSGYYYAVDCLPTVGALCEQADQQLFSALKSNPIHPFIHSYHQNAAHHRAYLPFPMYITMSSPPKLLVLGNVILGIAYCSLQRLFLVFIPLYVWFVELLLLIFNSGMCYDLIKAYCYRCSSCRPAWAALQRFISYTVCYCKLILFRPNYCRLSFRKIIKKLCNKVH